jgi:hypothetical protein
MSHSPKPETIEVQAAQAVDPAVICSPPEWLEEVIEAIGITDGVDLVKWHQDKDGDYIVEIEYGEEEMSFTAGTDGESHGADDDGTIHDMTAPSDVQWWCAGELHMRLQRAKRKIQSLEANVKDHSPIGAVSASKHEAQLEIDAANHRGMIAAATLRNELTSIKGELKHHLAAFDWMDGPEGWTESCQRLAAFIDANVG